MIEKDMIVDDTPLLLLTDIGNRVHEDTTTMKQGRSSSDSLLSVNGDTPFCLSTRVVRSFKLAGNIGVA